MSIIISRDNSDCDRFSLLTGSPISPQEVNIYKSILALKIIVHNIMYKLDK